MQKTVSSMGYSTSIQRWLGLPGFVAAYLVALGLFALFASRVHQLPGEIGFSVWVQSWRTAWLDRLMYSVSAPGLWEAGMPIVVATVAVLFFVGRRKESGLLLSAVTFATVANVALKWLIARPRPPDSVAEVFGSPSTFGFPSGHVMTYVVFLGLLVLLFSYTIRPSAWRRITYGALALGLVAVGVSRLYLGVHTLSDVLGGYAFGCGVVLVFGAIWLLWIDGGGKRSADGTTVVAFAQ